MCGQDLLKRFLSTNGPDFYGFAHSSETFSMERKPSRTEARQTKNGTVIPLPTGMDLELDWTIVS